MDERQERPSQDRNVLRLLADVDRPRVETDTDRQVTQGQLARVSTWQKCGGGWRRRAKRISE